jgi:hypothetical protein
MLDPGYSPGIADFYCMFRKIFGGFTPKKIKEDCDCVIMQWNRVKCLILPFHGVFSTFHDMQFDMSKMLIPIDMKVLPT